MKIKTDFSAQDCVELANKYKYEIIVFRDKLYDKKEFVELIEKVSNKVNNTSALYMVVHEAVNLKSRTP